MAHQRDPSRVYIFDTTNRDGEQGTSGAIQGKESKLIIAGALAVAHVDRIEAGFPFSSPADFEAVQAIAREVHGPMIFGLSRAPIQIGRKASTADIEITYAAVQDAEYRGIHVFSVLFDPYSLQQYGYTREQVVDGAAIGVAHAKYLLQGRGQVEFSFQNATTTNLDWVLEGYTRMVKAGADVVNVPDTVGYNHPEEIYDIITALRKELPSNVMISIHCHNDLGLAVANSLAAVKAGADIIECTVNGIGERAGNASLEEVVMNMAIRSDMVGGRTVGVDMKMLNYLSGLVSEHYDVPVQPNKAIVGSNAFRHRAGIHQDGMVKGRLYEIMRPEDVGWTGEGFELTARSGYAGVALRLKRLGYDVTDDLRGRLMPVFKALADEKLVIGDADLVCLMDTINGTAEPKYRLVDMSITKAEGSDDYTATVVLDMFGEYRSASSTNGATEHHHGAVNALYTAIDQVIRPIGVHLVSYQPINIGVGSEATAEVTVVLSRNPQFDGRIRPFDGMYVGRARHMDTLRASAMAYLDAVRKNYIAVAAYALQIAKT